MRLRKTHPHRERLILTAVHEFNCVGNNPVWKLKLERKRSSLLPGAVIEMTHPAIKLDVIFGRRIWNISVRVHVRTPNANSLGCQMAVVFSDQSRPIAEFFGDVEQVFIEIRETGGTVLPDPMSVRPSTGKEALARRHAQGSRCVCAIKRHSRGSQAIQSRHSIDRKAALFCESGAMLVGHDDQDVGPGLRRRLWGGLIR